MSSQLSWGEMNSYLLRGSQQDEQGWGTAPAMGGGIGHRPMGPLTRGQLGAWQLQTLPYPLVLLTHCSWGKPARLEAQRRGEGAEGILKAAAVSTF